MLVDSSTLAKPSGPLMTCNFDSCQFFVNIKPEAVAWLILLVLAVARLHGSINLSF